VVRRPVDEAADPGQLVGVVQRAVVDALLVGRAGGGGPRGVRERRREIVVDAGGGEDPGRGRAVLPGVEVAGDGDRLGRRSTQSKT